MRALIRNLRGLFAFFTLVGVAIIAIFALHPTNALARALVQSGNVFHSYVVMAAIVVGLMLVYGFFVWMREGTEYQTDSDGETVYYLGFIYTLATLVFTFVPLLDKTGGLDPKTALGLFGLGLITTFIGLAGRIFFLRLGSSAESVIDLPARRVADALEEAARRIEKSSIGQKVHEATERIEQTLSRFEGRVNAIRLPTGELSERIDHLLAQVAAEAQKLNALVGALPEQYRRLGQAVDYAAEKAIKGTAALDGLTKSSIELSGATKQTTESARNASSNLERFAAGLSKSDSLSKQIENLTQAVELLNQRVSSVNGSLQITGPVLEEIGSKGRTAIDGLGALQSPLHDIAKAASATASNLLSVGGKLQEIVHLSSDAISKSKAAADDQVKLLGDLAKQLDSLKSNYHSTLETLDKIRSQIETEIKASSAAVTIVHSNLAQFAREVAQQVKRRE